MHNAVHCLFFRADISKWTLLQEWGYEILSVGLIYEFPKPFLLILRTEHGGYGLLNSN